MPHQKIEKIPFQDHRLGRHVSHDLRSAAYNITEPVIKPVLRSIRHGYEATVFLNQGQRSACTGFALAHALNCSPNKQARKYSDEDALGIYSLATELDSFPGTFTPDDTGSSGLAACKAAKQLGYISRYEWCFGFDAALVAIQRAPLMIGTRWYSWMYHPDVKGRVRVAGTLSGGHQFLMVGIELIPPYTEFSNLCWYLNSWGTSFGVNGYFAINFADTRRLLVEDGDLVRPII